MRNRLFHISDDPNVKIFEPRPSPSYFENIRGDVVFAISDTLLHNYLLPRECPRVTFYTTQNTSELDKEVFLGKTLADYIIAIDSKWYKTVQQATLYCYEFPLDNFFLLDKGADYYISYKTVIPIAMYSINNILEELRNRNVELRVTDTLRTLAKEVSESTLQYSLIRMRNVVS